MAIETEWLEHLINDESEENLAFAYLSVSGSDKIFYHFLATHTKSEDKNIYFAQIFLVRLLGFSKA